MEAVCRRRAIPSPPPSLSPINGHGTSGASVASFAAQPLSYQDDTINKGSRWPDRNDASIASSRVVMPEPPPSHSSPPLASSGSQTPFPSRPSTVPPMLPRSPGDTSGRQLVANGRVPSLSPRPIDLPRSVPKSQPPRQPNSSRPTTSIQAPIYDDKLPENEAVSRSSHASNHRRGNYKTNPSATGGHTRPWRASPSPMSPGRSVQANRSMPPKHSSHVAGPTNSRRHSRRSRSTRRHSESSDAGSSTFSATRPPRDWSWSSASSSDDPITYRNARHFPPRLPAAPAYQFSAPRNRPSAANQIASWVSQYEKSQSPKRVRIVDIPPTTFSGDTESDVDDSADSGTPSYPEVEILWQQLKEKRSRVVELRNDMTERRKALRELRHNKDEADNDFMNILRPMLVNHGGLPRTSTSLLSERMGRMQSLRDDYHFRESTYENLELGLDEEEKELNDLETKFFSLLAAGQTGADRDSPTWEGSDTASQYPPDTPYALIGISRDGPSEDLHPLYIQLTSALGDLENVKEELEDLVFVKNQYENDIKMKAPLGLKPLDDVEEYLAEFPAEEASMTKNITRLQDDVKRLRNLCEDKKVMRKHLSIRMEYALNPMIKYEDMDLEDKNSILANHKTLAHGTFPELLSQPDYVLSRPQPLTAQAALLSAAALPDNHPAKRGQHWLASKEYAIERLMQDHESGGRADFVNRWLLQQLRLSPLNAILLYSTFMTSRSLKIKDMWRWQCDVLHYWWRDSATALTEGVYNQISNDDESEYSEYSSRLGTPQLSRAASEGEGRGRRRDFGRDARTVHG